MPLSPGTRLGSYEVISSLGAGGMGEVYCARDTKLNRDVALKILPESFAADADRVARFTREAQTLATLNHPNIAQIHGLEESGGVRALVMELVTGDDLSVQLSRGPLSLSHSLHGARQIADALEAAHEAGIVHRDLKPANIKVRADGTVKVLDFGLAKALDTNASGATAGTLTNSPTGLSPAGLRQGVGGAGTEIGMILGTAAYMSPEQARGKAVDRRCDIWAFGVVLYEMLTGRAMFSGDTVTDVIAAVVTRDPEWTHLPPDTPPAIRRLLHRCLEKDPRRRIRDIADVRFELDAGVADEPPTVNEHRRPRWLWPALAGIALIVGLTIGLLVRGSPGAAGNGPRRVTSIVAPGAGTKVVISPNGEWLAATLNGRLQVRRLDDASWREIPNVDGMSARFCWSPDSRQIMFVAGRAFRKVDLVGSRPQTICDDCNRSRDIRGATWSRHGTILVGGIALGDDAVNGLWSIPDQGGAPTQVTRVDRARGENSHRFPAFLPDGQRFLFTVRRDNGEHEIRIGSLDGSTSRTVASAFSEMAYAAGYVLFIRDETLLAQPFDLTAGAVSGDPVKVADRVKYFPTVGDAGFSVADDGTLVYTSAPDTVGLQWFDRQGLKIGTLTTVRSDAGARVSRDGTRVLAALNNSEHASTDIYAIDAASGALARLTRHPNWEQSPAWSPDGRQFAFRGVRERRGLYLQDIDGVAERLVVPDDAGSPTFGVDDWSPDGEHLLVSHSSPTGPDLFLVSAISPGAPKLWVATNGAKSSGRFSPDGRFVAYVSAETGSPQVHVRSFDPPTSSRRVTTLGGENPVWSRNTRELFYVDDGQWITAVSITLGATVDVGPPRRLFKPGLKEFQGSSFDVDPKGRFLIYTLEDRNVTPTFSVVHMMINWTTGLKK